MDIHKIVGAEETIFNVLAGQQMKKKILDLVKEDIEKLGISEFPEMHLLLRTYKIKGMFREESYGYVIFYLIKKETKDRMDCIISDVNIEFSDINFFSRAKEFRIVIKERGRLIKNIIERTPQCWLRCSTSGCDKQIPSTVVEKDGKLFRIPCYGEGIKLIQGILFKKHHIPIAREMVLCKECVEKFFPIEVSKSKVEEFFPELAESVVWHSVEKCEITIG